MDDKQFESYLREFEPRQPHPLPELAPPAPDWRRRLLAAAVVILAGTTAVWFAARRTNHVQPRMPSVIAPSPLAMAPPTRPRTILQFTRLAQQDPRQLDAALDAASRKLLPEFTGKNSTLATLAKE